MILSVSLYTNALGIQSSDHYYVSPEQLEKGVDIVSLFPESYVQYVKGIFVKIVDEGNTIELTSDYGSVKYSVDEQHWWSAKDIGLSYAVCDVYIQFIPLYRPTWDQLTVTHEGCTEVFQREEIKDGDNLAKLHPRPDGSLIPWLDITVSYHDNDGVGLRQKGKYFQVKTDGESVEATNAVLALRSFSTLITEWDEIEQKPVTAIVDTQDLNDSIKDAEAAFRIAEEIQEQRPEHLEFIAQYMGYAADLGSKDAEVWLRDYYEEDDSKYHPFV